MELVALGNWVVNGIMLGVEVTVVALATTQRRRCGSGSPRAAVLGALMGGAMSHRGMVVISLLTLPLGVHTSRRVPNDCARRARKWCTCSHRESGDTASLGA